MELLNLNQDSEKSVAFQIKTRDIGFVATLISNRFSNVTLFILQFRFFSIQFAFCCSQEF